MDPVFNLDETASRRGFRLPRARIDLEALVANCRLARRLAGDARVLAVVKADAYGHGAPAVAKALAGVADALAVARVDEGVALRREGIETPIAVLQGCLASGELEEAARQGLEVVVHREDQLVKLIGGHRLDDQRVWLKLDTGMHRLGFDVGDFSRASGALAAALGVAEVVAMSHLACADELDNEFTRIQLERFSRATEGFDGRRSLANSAGLLAWPDTRFDWVRPGIMLYGASPLDALRPEAAELRPVMCLESEVIAIRRVEAGGGVGYGQRYVCAEPTRIGTVAIGYGDGYPRAAPDGTPVAVAGHRTRLLGRVSMDSLTVDLTGLPGVGVGARVELWGGEVRVEEVARACGTISYELLTRVAPRVPREYSPLP